MCNWEHRHCGTAYCIYYSCFLVHMKLYTPSAFIWSSWNQAFNQNLFMFALLKKQKGEIILVNLKGFTNSSSAWSKLLERNSLCQSSKPLKRLGKNIKLDLNVLFCFSFSGSTSSAAFSHLLNQSSFPKIFHKRIKRGSFMSTNKSSTTPLNPHHDF